MKKLFSLFVVALMAMSAMATDYNKTPLTLDAGETNGQEMKLTIYRSGDLETTVIATSTTSEFLSDPELNLYECFFQNWGGGSPQNPVRSEATVTNDNGVSTLQFTFTWTTYPTASAQLRFVPRRDNSAGGSDIFGGTATSINMDYRIYRDYTITVYTTNGAPYIHAYNDAGFVYKAWADDEMMSSTSYANTYTYTVHNAPIDGIKVIVRNHEKDKQAAAIDVTDDAIFNVYYDGENDWAFTAASTTAHNMIDVTIKVNADQAPRIHYWGVADAPEWDADPDMSLVPGYTDWYEYTVSNVDENNGVDYIIRLGSEQSVNQSTLVDVCRSTSIDNNAEKKVLLEDTDCPAQVVPDAPHASEKGFGTYQMQGLNIYAHNNRVPTGDPVGTADVYVVNVGNKLLAKVTLDDGKTFDGAPYSSQIMTWPNEPNSETTTGRREQWLRHRSNDHATTWMVDGDPNQDGIDNCGDLLYLTSYFEVSGAQYTMAEVDYHKDYINNPTLDNVAPTLTAASVEHSSLTTYTINVAATSDDEIFFYFIDKNNDKAYVSFTNSIDITSDRSNVAHTFECYAVDYNGNMSAKREVSVAMESIQVPAAPAPVKDAANVLSIYSDAYTSVVNGGNRCAWNGAVSVTEIEPATNNHAYLYTLTNSEASNWFGWDYAVKEGYKADGTTGIDASEMTALHVDIWSATDGAISVYPIYGGGVPTKDVAFYRFNLTANQWTSVDITYAMLQNKPAEGYDWSSIFQLKFAGCTATGSIAIDNVYFWKEAPKAYDLTTADTDWYSLYLDYAVTIPSGMAAYTGEVSNDALNVTAIETGVIPANTAVLVKSTAAGTYTFDETTSAAFNGTNDLKGVLEATAVSSLLTANKKLLVLGSGSNGVGFYNKTSGNVAANRAYLLIETPAAAPALRIIEVENTATAIDALAGSATEVVKFIENGKILIMKNGVVYDVLGNVVR